MAQRHLLHKNKVADFVAWLDHRGIPNRAGRGEYELLQVRRSDGQWFKLYRRESMPEHVTVQQPLVDLVRQFISDSRLHPTTATPAMTTDPPHPDPKYQGMAPWDDQPELEKCPFCGATVESPCDEPPPDTCEKALNATYG
jgi:hypothetical protein